MMKDDIPEEAWPKGVPLRQRAVWIMLDDDQRAIARRRVAAIRAYEEGRGAKSGSRLGAEKAAEMAGVKVDRFFRLADAWRRERSLASIVPRATKARRTSRGESIASGAIDRIRVAVEVADDSASIESIVVTLMEDGKGLPSQSFLRRLVAKERGAAMRKRAVEQGGMGSIVLVDASGVGIAVEREDASASPHQAHEAGEWPICAFVVDAASARVLGHAVSRVEGSGDIYAEAAAVAADMVAPWQATAPGVHGRFTRFVIVMKPDDPMQTLRRYGSIMEVDATAEVHVDEKDDPYGERLMMLIGRHLDGLDLRPRAASFDEQGRQDASAAPRLLTLAEARIVVAAAVEAYNDRIADERRVDGDLPVAVDGAMLAARLRGLFRSAA